jgi:putative CocE/NonD family hydrolase
MMVHGLWDQEDIYGAPAVYKAIEPKDTANDKVFLVMGPWNHGQQIGDGSSLGAIRFHSDTGLYFRREILRPFLDQYLKDDAPKANLAPVIAFETGTNKWRELPAWPPAAAKTTRLYLQPNNALAFQAPSAGGGFTEYISDPAKPVPFRARPVRPPGYDPAKGLTWPQWLVDDQREASGRTDVVAFVSEPLTAPLKITGETLVHLVASTTGSDADWVVKLIDVYPDEVASQPELGGYQLAIAMDIFRGRYRESLELAKPIEPGKALAYRFALPNANHVFQKGHRLMVQIQSSWFPLYDRNPQTFVPNIFLAKPEDFKKATHRIHHSASEATYLELPVAPQ